MVAQLATARAAAATNSSFILTDTGAKQSKEIPCDLQETTQVVTELFHFSFVSRPFCVMTFPFTCTTARALFPDFFESLFHPSHKLIFMSLYFFSFFFASVHLLYRKWVWVLFVCMHVCPGCSCLPASMSICAVKFEVQLPVEDAGLRQGAVLI